MHIRSRGARARVGKVAGLCAVLALLSGSGSAYACNDDEKGAWLCIIHQFIYPECSGPQAAVRKRTLRGDEPLPPFDECSGDGGASGLEAKFTVAALIDDDPQWYHLGTRCSQRSRNDQTNNYGNIRNTNPPNCIGTYRAIIVYQHGEQMGPVYFERMR